MGAGESRVRTTKPVGKAPAPKKRFSQNYLTDQTIARKIVAALAIGPTDVVIEIGPGPGALTQWLVQTPCRHIIAADIDQRSLDHLRTLPWYDAKKIELINADVLTLTVETIKATWNAERVVVIGNIPYGITSDILFWLFEQRRFIATAVITMQREVARRCVAAPNSKDYGILTIATWFASEAKLLFHIQPGSFFPKPEVISSVVRFVFRAQDPREIQFESFMEFVRSAFSQRRKVMTNALRTWAAAHKNVTMFESLERVGHDLSKIRSESLSAEELMNVYVSLTRSSAIHE